MWGYSAGLNREKNLCANLLMSFGTKATDCFLTLSTIEAANVFLGGCWGGGDKGELKLGEVFCLADSPFDPEDGGIQGR